MLWFEGVVSLLLLALVSTGWLRLRRSGSAGDRRAAGSRGPGPHGSYHPHRGPGRFAAMTADDDEAFLRYCRERAAQQRREFRLRRDPLPEGGPWLEDGLSGAID